MMGVKGIALGIMGAAAGLLLYCGSFYVRSYVENKHEQEKYENIEADCLDTERENTGEKISNDKKRRKADRGKDGKRSSDVSEDVKESFGISWEKLRETNQEIAAWITVPGADISYPVVRGKDDEYYLLHSFTGEESPFGCIFLSCVNENDFLDSHSFIYGHNMEGNMMFANLNRYENPGFLESCPGFYITTPRRKFYYEIFSVEQAEEYGSSFRYGYELGSEAYKEQIELLKANSMYDTGVIPDAKQRTATLVTCNSRLEEHVRMAVHGICRESAAAQQFTGIL